MSSLPPNKRRRGDGDTDNNENPDRDTGLIRPDKLKSFTWDHKVKDMDPANLLQYIPSLPEKTQYFDLNLLLRAYSKPDTYSVGFLSTWRDISLNAAH